MSKLTTKKRNGLSASSFAGPDRTYPDNDASHARNALSRVGDKGPRLKAEVRAKVHRDYPGIKMTKGEQTHHKAVGSHEGYRR